MAGIANDFENTSLTELSSAPAENDLIKEMNDASSKTKSVVEF